MSSNKDTYLHQLLGENERILFSARKHWFLLVSAIAAELLILAVIFSAAIALVIWLSESPWLWLVPIIAFLLMLAPIVTMVRDILQWTHHQYIVTNWRVIQIGGVINKNITDSSLEKVNDVKMTQSVLGRTFNYGDIEILTASELGVNLFQRIEDPVNFKKAMLNAKEALESGRRHAGMPDQPPALDIPGMIAQLDQLRKQGIISEQEFQQKKAELLARL
jgi:uncharacterized membrane protein YdbT with pleckstrin-like domain